MYKKIFVGSLGLVLLASPLFAVADALSDQLDEARFLRTREAGALVNFDSSKMRCVTSVSTATPRAGERFLLSWGSFGADYNSAKNTWTQNGAYVIIVNKPGTYRYTFTFYGADGTPVSCQTQVFVK